MYSFFRLKLPVLNPVSTAWSYISKTCDMKYTTYIFLARVCVIAKGERLMLFYSDLLGAIMHCISDSDSVVCERAGEANKDLLSLVQVSQDDQSALLVQFEYRSVGSRHGVSRAELQRMSLIPL